jgi:hypothetical protein
MKIPFLKHLAWATLAIGSIGVTKAALVTEYAMNLLTVNRTNTIIANGTNANANWNQTIGYNHYVVGAPEIDTAYTTLYLAFYLPTLVAGQSFSNFALNVSNYYGEGSTVGDLYGMGTSNTASPSSLYYYAGATADTAHGASLQQSNYLTLTRSTPLGTNWLASADLSTYVNGLYTSGVPTNQYLLLRLSAQDTNGLISIGGFSAVYGGNGVNTDPTTGVFTGTPTGGWPANYVSYNVVPEPTTWALLAGGAGMLVMFRRRSA